MTGLNTAAVLDKLVSHAQELGLFAAVNTHEYKSAPGKGLFCEIWAQTIAPARSGLDATSAMITFNVRVRTDMIAEPQDAIDPEVMGAVDALMDAYTGDFTFGGALRNVDLLAGASAGLRADAGYLDHGGKLFRIMTITVPVTVNDCWNQEA